MSEINNNLPVEWIDQIPTRPSAFKARVIGVALLALLVFGAWVYDFSPPPVEATVEAQQEASTDAALAEAEAEAAAADAAAEAEDESDASDAGGTTSTEEVAATDSEVVATATLPHREGPLGFLYECGPGIFERALASSADVEILFEEKGIKRAIFGCFTAFGALGLFLGMLGVLSFWRSRISYTIVRHGMLVAFPVIATYVYFVWQAVFAVEAAELQFMGADAESRAHVLIAWWTLSWPALAMAIYVGWTRTMTNCRSVRDFYCGEVEKPEPMAGDFALEDIRTHGRDPRSRKSLYTSIFTHVMILVVIPWLMTLGGCVEAYKVPKGSGEPAVAVMVKVQKKKKKKKTLSLRPNSAILFDIPDLDDTEVDKIMEEQTQLTYEASANAKAGKIGKGGGDKGGWPEGMDDYKIRFIRLDHGGKGWDDGMNHTQADINFLREFARATGFKKIARKGESHSIALLDKYPDDGFPPFVYLTGNHHMGRVSSRDVKILREYCLKGGMLIGDAGSRTFDSSFRNFMRQVFPDKQLIDIADDDVIYQLPFGFPNGAPAFWHHGGRRALGIKHEGRWVCFYHPGDMNDAWKAQGYTDVTPEMRKAAMNLGVNLVYYAFNQWDDAVAKAKK